MRNKSIRKIVLATAGVIFSLATAVSSTYAWFLMNSSVEEEVSSFTIGSPSGAQFNLYYLRNFTVGLETKNGNWNNAISMHAGYEISYADANFVKVELDGEGRATGINNPTCINQLWPAHRLTFAIVMTQGNASTLSLLSWDDVTDPGIVNDSGRRISLSWAINMYGKAYSVSKTVNEINDVKTAFISYRDNAPYIDAFACTDGGTMPSLPMTIISTVPAVSNLQRSILFFTIEFSNDSETWYSYDKENDYFVQDSDAGNSNCYETLELNNLVFGI